MQGAGFGGQPVAAFQEVFDVFAAEGGEMQGVGQRAWLAALLTLRQAGAEQYRWCRTLRGSGRNNRRQFRHLRRLRFVIGWDPPAVDDADTRAGTGRPKKTRRRKRRNVYWKLLEEDAAEENDSFTPVE